MSFLTSSPSSLSICMTSADHPIVIAVGAFIVIVLCGDVVDKCSSLGNVKAVFGRELKHYISHNCLFSHQHATHWPQCIAASVNIL